MQTTTVQEPHPAAQARIQFVQRLTAALLAAGCEPTPTKIARDFDLRFPGNAVTVQAVRRWMKGETYPAESKIMALAAWLDVDPAWLRFGDTSAHPAPAFEERQDDGLERDLPLFNAAERSVLRKVADLMLEVRAARTLATPPK